MDITPVLSENLQIVQNYGEGGFRIAGTEWQGSVMVLPTRTMTWPVQDFASVTATDFAMLEGLRDEVEMLLIGCGKTQGFVKPSLRQELRRMGYIVDAMDTGAACRTFNILLAEERRVVAALIRI